MTKLLTQLATMLSDGKTTAERQWLELVLRADRPKAGDARRLAGVLQTLGRTAEDFAAAVEAVAEARRCERLIAELDARKAAAKAASEALNKHRAAVAEAERAARRKGAELLTAHETAQRALKEAASADRRLAELRAARPELLAAAGAAGAAT